MATRNVSKAKDLLAGLSKSKKPVNQKKENEKVKLDLPAALQPGFVRAAGLNHLAKDVDKAQEREKLPLTEYAYDQWLDKLWRAKTRPSTMEAEVREGGVVDCSANFIVQARYKITLPKPKNEDQTPEEAAIIAIAAALNAKGMEEEEAEAVATRFVNTELDLSLKPRIDLDKWLRGREEGSGTNKTWVEATPEEQDMASRALMRLQATTAEELAEAPLSPEELGKLIEYVDNPSVRPGFMERIAGYVHSKDQLAVLLTFVRPTHFFSGFQFGEGGTPNERNERKVELARQVIGLATES